MSTVCSAVRVGQGYVGMNHRFAIAQRYVTKETGYLQGLFDFKEFVLTRLLIIDTKSSLFDGPNRFNATKAYTVLFADRCQLFE